MTRSRAARAVTIALATAAGAGLSWVAVSPDDVTRELELARGGDRGALDRAFARVYDELRRLAHVQLARRAAGQTLVTTALVHEAYLRLVAQPAPPRDRQHFFALAATAMRHVLVDRARRRMARKRGGGEPAPVLVDEARLAAGDRAAEVLALDGALAALAEVDPPLARLVEIRFFGGLSLDEAADVLDVSRSTVKRQWREARAFLYRELAADGRP